MGSMGKWWRRRGGCEEGWGVSVGKCWAGVDPESFGGGDVTLN